MAWGSQGQVFLGEDLMHTRDYSEDTSRVIDDEVERILRTQEERAMELLTRHRGGLDAVAHALLEQESIDGEEVGRLIDEAFGSPVHTDGPKAKTIRFNGNGNGNGSQGGNGHTPSGALPAGARGGTAARARRPEHAPVPGAQQAPAGNWPPPWPQQQGWTPSGPPQGGQWQSGQWNPQQHPGYWPPQGPQQPPYPPAPYPPHPQSHPGQHPQHPGAHAPHPGQAHGQQPQAPQYPQQQAPQYPAPPQSQPQPGPQQSSSPDDHQGPAQDGASDQS